MKIFSESVYEKNSNYLVSEPYPHAQINGFLKDESFMELSRNFPSIDLFTKSFGVERPYGQAPHNRYVLQLKPRDSTGCLPDIWREFVKQIQSNVYFDFLSETFGVSKYRMSLGFAWHLTPKGSSVSPHCDSIAKVGSHLFYFNQEDEWEEEWGGQTLVMDDPSRRISPRSAPSFEELNIVAKSTVTGNSSFLFERTSNSWHGVSAIEAPEGKMRKMFLVTIMDRYIVYEKKFREAFGIKDRGFSF